MSQRKRHPRGSSNHSRQPHDRNDSYQHVDDLCGSGTGIDRGIDLGAVRRNRTTHCDQSREPDQCQRSRIEDRIEPRALGAGAPGDSSHDSLVVKREATEQVGVVQFETFLLTTLNCREATGRITHLM